MPTQRFSPMTKDFPTFDCDAHIVEPALVWEMATENLPKDELDALKNTMWYDPATNQMLVNGVTDVSNFYPVPDVGPGKIDIVRLAGPGMKHDIQRAINVRNVNPETAITAEQSRYLAHDGAGEPGPRLRDMDVQGIDQVMIIPSDIDTYPWLQNALGAKSHVQSLQRLGLQLHPRRPRPPLLRRPATHAKPQVRRRRTIPRRRDGLPRRPHTPYGRPKATTPSSPNTNPLWNALEDTGVVYGMHPFPAFGNAKPPGYTEQYSGAELIRRTMTTAGLPHRFLANVQNFQAEAALWVTLVLMSGFFERHPKINAAVFEASSTWLSFLLDECDKTYTLYRNERKLPALKQLPSETFFQHCVTGFEGDEAPPSRLPEFYKDILAWSSDVYHHDGDDAWAAIGNDGRMRTPHRLPSPLPSAATPAASTTSTSQNIIHHRVTEIHRPDWWPTEQEITASLHPQASLPLHP